MIPGILMGFNLVMATWYEELLLKSGAHENLFKAEIMIQSIKNEAIQEIRVVYLPTFFRVVSRIVGQPNRPGLLLLAWDDFNRNTDK